MIKIRHDKLLDRDEWRHFWIRVNPNGLIEVGKRIEDPPFLIWKDDFLRFDNYAVASHTSGTVDWATECPN